MRRFRIYLLAVCWLMAFCAGAKAQASDTTPYRLYPALDAATLGVSAVVWWGPSLFPSSFVAADGCECRAASLNALDRPFAGTYSTGFFLASELLIASAYIATVVLDLLEVVHAGQPITSFLTDIAVIAEAVLLNGAINQIVKMTTTRPRPLLYGLEPGDSRQSDPDSYLSFYSAHTSSAFAVALAYAQTFAYRHPESPYRFLVYAAAIVAGSGIGATRIAAGKHFPTDVLVGAAAGATIGLSIPWLHQRNPRAQLSVTATPQGFGLSLAISQL